MDDATMDLPEEQSPELVEAQEPELETPPKLMRGFVGVVLGTALGCAVWATASYITGYKIGWLAIAVGLCIGATGLRLAGKPCKGLGWMAVIVAMVAINVAAYAAHVARVYGPTFEHEGIRAFYGEVKDELRAEGHSASEIKEMLPASEEFMQAIRAESWEVGGFLRARYTFDTKDIKGELLGALFCVLAVGVAWQLGSAGALSNPIKVRFRWRTCVLICLVAIGVLWWMAYYHGISRPAFFVAPIVAVLWLGFTGRSKHEE